MQGSPGAQGLPGPGPLLDVCAEYTDALMYYDCCSLATLIGENVEVSISAAGLGDTTSEPTGIVALYNALNCKVTLTVYQNRSHTYNPPAAETYKKNK